MLDRREYQKRRAPATPGSIADVLGMFRAEVRFYREIAPVVGVRVPACYRAEDGPDGTLLVLEDLSDWAPGADPVAYARLLHHLHARWRGIAPDRWPWLRRPGAAAAEVADLYARVWPSLSEHQGLTARVRAIGARLLDGVAVTSWHRPPTLCHGDASARNARTSASGEIAVVDWEDVNVGDGLDDMAWLLVSSVPPERWNETMNAYGVLDGWDAVWPDAIQQGLFSLSDDPDGPDAAGWCARLAAAGERLAG
jgi:hypothetical protein